MGAWPVLLHRFLEAGFDPLPRYVGRAEAASPATGSHRRHREEQARLVSGALDLP